MEFVRVFEDPMFANFFFSVNVGLKWKQLMTLCFHISLSIREP